MPTFYVILEDVPPPMIPVNQKVWIIRPPVNRRVKEINSNSLDDAWDYARKVWYVHKIDGPTTQIVDIVTESPLPPAPPATEEDHV